MQTSAKSRSVGQRLDVRRRKVCVSNLRRRLPEALLETAEKMPLVDEPPAVGDALDRNHTALPVDQCGMRPLQAALPHPVAQRNAFVGGNLVETADRNADRLGHIA